MVTSSDPPLNMAPWTFLPFPFSHHVLIIIVPIHSVPGLLIGLQLALGWVLPVLATRLGTELLLFFSHMAGPRNPQVVLGVMVPDQGIWEEPLAQAWNGQNTSAWLLSMFFSCEYFRYIEITCLSMSLLNSCSESGINFLKTLEICYYIYYARLLNLSINGA